MDKTQILTSVPDSQNRAFYQLEYLDPPGKDYAPGQVELIYVPEISVGRDGICTVCCDHHPTVSRQHFLIKYTGRQGIRLIPLSRTNPTLVNDRPVTKEVVLADGDILQPSYEGPRIRFLTRASTVIGMPAEDIPVLAPSAGRWIPYALALLLLLLLGGWGWSKIGDKGEPAIPSVQESQSSQTSDTGSFATLPDSLSAQVKPGAEKKSVRGVTRGTAASSAFLPVDRLPALQVFRIRTTSVVIEHLDGRLEPISISWRATGFLINGKLVTARHAVQPYRFAAGWDNAGRESIRDFSYLNQWEENGARLRIAFEALAPDSTVIHFTNSELRYDDSRDSLMRFHGAELRTCPPEAYATDWAILPLKDSRKGIPVNQAFGRDPHRATVYLMGYRFDREHNNRPVPNHDAAECQPYLEQGLIRITAPLNDHGDSGGPVVLWNPKRNRFEVVGVMSCKEKDKGIWAVPIDQLK